MGRFYKTSSASPLDYMYQINTPLMERVISANDNYISQNLKQTDALDNAAENIPALVSDQGRAQELTQGYTQKINDIADQIRQDPANWRKKVGDIRDVSNDLQQNYKTGEISKIAGNYNNYKQASDYIDKQVDEYNKGKGNGISAENAEAYKKYMLNSLQDGTKYDSSTGKYNSISAFNPMGDVNIQKFLSEGLDKLKADKSKYKTSDIPGGNDMYFNDKTQAWEGVTPERILNIISERAQDPHLKDYLGQLNKVGIIPSEQLTNPYTYNPVPVSDQEQANLDAMKSQIAKEKDPNRKSQLQSMLTTAQTQFSNRKAVAWNDKSYLAPVMKGIVDQYAYGQTDSENYLRNNTVGTTRFVQGQANARQAAALGQAKQLATDKEKGIDDRFKQTLAFDKYKWDNPHATGKGTPTIGKDGKPIVAPIESSVSRLATNSFDDWNTTDQNGQPVKVLSNTGLSSDIDKMNSQLSDLNKNISGLDTSMKDVLGNRRLTDLSPTELVTYNAMRVKKNDLEGQLPELQSDLNSRRKWYEASTVAALTNNQAAKRDKDGDVGEDLTPEEVKQYNKFSNDRAGKATIDKIEQEAKAQGFVFTDANTGAYSNRFSEWLDGVANQTPELRGMRQDLTNYFKVKQKVDQRRDNFLAQMRYTPIDTDAINVGQADGNAVAQEIFSNPQGLKIYDATGNKADTQQMDGKGINWLGLRGRKSALGSDNYNMTLAGQNPDLVAYMQKHNVQPIIEQVGNTTKIGSGNAVVKVRFNDPNGEIPNSPYYIELTPEMQKRIGTRLATSNKNPDVQKIASSLLDDEGNNLRRQLITPTVKRTAGETGTDPVTFTIFVSNGNKKIPLQVTKSVGENGTDHLSVTQSVNGVQSALGSIAGFPKPESGIPGWFNGSEDLIGYIKKLKGQ